MTLEEKYEILHKQLAVTFRTSPRVIQAIRSARASQYKEDDIRDFITSFKDQLEKKMVQANQVLRTAKLDAINDITRRERGLRQDNQRMERLKESLPVLLKSMDTMSYHVSIVEFLKRHAEIAIKEICEAQYKEGEKSE